MRQYRYISIVGSRTAKKDDVEDAFKKFKLSPKHHVIVSGGARGADAFARDIAQKDGFHYIEVPADWFRGMSAGLERNGVIVDVADAVIAVWDGKSRGTKDTIDKAKAAGKKLEVFLAMGAHSE